MQPVNSSNNPDFLNALRSVLQSDDDVVSGAQVPESYLSDWLEQHHGRAGALARPRTTAQVAALVRLCKDAAVPIVPYGGNTSWRGGATPDNSGRALLLSLENMRTIRSVNPTSGVLIAEAGCILETVQQAAADVGMFFPLHIGASGSCQIGGNLATNAGGVNVLRYGNARDLCLGIEAVLPDGETLHLLSALRKDNTGYDLKNLLIGSEGTLGIITAAALRIFPQPQRRATAFIVVPSVSAALALLPLCQKHTGGMMESFELMPEILFTLLQKHLPQLPQPFSPPPPLAILAEAAGDETVEDKLLAAIEEGLNSELLSDAVLASSEAQRQQFWQLRETSPEATRREGQWHKMDVSLPLDCLSDFISDAERLTAADTAGQYIIAFGHLGDGNLHLSLRPSGAAPKDNPQQTADMEQKLLEIVKSYGGSFSAEHGIGQSKIKDMKTYKDATALATMRAIKRVIDPDNLMNPGKVLP